MPGLFQLRIFREIRFLQWADRDVEEPRLTLKVIEHIAPVNIGNEVLLSADIDHPVAVFGIAVRRGNKDGAHLGQLPFDL